jgi:hypothetical protein
MAQICKYVHHLLFLNLRCSVINSRIVPTYSKEATRREPTLYFGVVICLKAYWDAPSSHSTVIQQNMQSEWTYTWQCPFNLSVYFQKPGSSVWVVTGKSQIYHSPWHVLENLIFLMKYCDVLRSFRVSSGKKKSLLLCVRGIQQIILCLTVKDVIWILSAEYFYYLWDTPVQVKRHCKLVSHVAPLSSNRTLLCCSHCLQYHPL